MSMIGFEPGLEFDPFREFRRMTRTMNRLLSDAGDVCQVGQGGGGLLTAPILGEVIAPVEKQWSPLVDVRETDKEIIVHVELPGVKKEDVKLEVRDNRLIISGERKQEKKEEGERFHRVERTYGKFLRTLALPSGIDPSNIRANFENGVLEVVTPKPDTGGKPTTISIGLKGDQPKLEGDKPKFQGDQPKLKGDKSKVKGDQPKLKGDKPKLKTGSTTASRTVGERRGEKEGERTGFDEGQQTEETGSSRVNVGEAQGQVSGQSGTGGKSGIKQGSASNK